MKQTSLDMIDPSDYDVVIAGAGAGGLLTALALTAEGKRSLLLERSERLGGVWHGYRLGGYRVDQGLHMITRVTRGSFSRFMRSYLTPPPQFVLHEGWHFRVDSREGTIPSSIGQTLRWPLAGMKGRLSLARIGARIKTMSLEEMKQYKDISFLQFMHSRGVTNQIILDVMQSAIYMAAGVGIERASAYEALRTLRDTDKESSKLASFKKLLFGIGIEYDEGVAIGGMLGLIERVTNAIAGDYVLGAPVEMIRQQGDLIRLRVAGKEIDHRLVVSNIPLSSMPNLVKAEKPEVSAFFERWSHLEPTYGLTLWLGLNQVVIGDRKSRVLVHPRPNRWILSLSSFDPSCAPEGKELVAIATVSDRSRSVEEQVQVIKENGLTDYIPGLLDHVEMEHVQTSYATRAALIPGQTDLDRPGPETPLKGLYIVGTDTAGSGVGLQQAANSADCVIRSLRSKF